MLTFVIPNLSCGHCVRSVSEAILAADAQARIDVDLATQRVQVQTSTPREVLVARLIEAGYPPD